MNVDPNIIFTTESESNDVLPFLDTCMHINDDDSTHVTVYRKPTHTDQYSELQIKSSHRTQTVCCVYVSEKSRGPGHETRRQVSGGGSRETSTKKLRTNQSEPGRSTLNVLNYKYKYFPPRKYLSTSTVLFGEMYLSTFRVLSRCT